MQEPLEVIPGVHVLPLLTPEECDFVIEEANRANWQTAQVVRAREEGGSILPTHRSSDVCFFRESTAVWDLVHRAIEQTVRPLVHNAWGRDFPQHSEVHVLRYSPGNFFKAHRDSGAEGSGIANRYFSVVCYLNDDFEGGQTTFPQEKYSVVPEKGRAVVFPADYVHQGDEIRSGSKYILVTWLIDQPPPRWL